MNKREEDFKYLEEAKIHSLYSKDKTKIGAVITDPNKEYIISSGYNRIPNSLNSSWYEDREMKNLLILHAEENAIDSSNNLKGCHLYLYGPITPCAHCASKIIEASIASITCLKTPYAGNSWSKSTEIAFQVLTEANLPVKIYMYNDEEFDNLFLGEKK